MELIQVLALIRGALQTATTATKLLADMRSTGQVTEEEYNRIKDSLDDTDSSWREQLDRLTGG